MPPHWPPAAKSASNCWSKSASDWSRASAGSSCAAVARSSPSSEEERRACRPTRRRPRRDRRPPTGRRRPGSSLRLRRVVARRRARPRHAVAERGGQLPAGGELDRDRRAREPGDAPGVLLAVLDPVVVRVAIARVEAEAELGAVPEPVAVGVALARVRVRAVLAVVGEPVVVVVAAGVVALQVQVVLALPAVGELVVVALARQRGRGGQRSGGDEEGERRQDAVKAGHGECIGTLLPAFRSRVRYRTKVRPCRAPPSPRRCRPRRC